MIHIGDYKNLNIAFDNGVKFTIPASQAFYKDTLLRVTEEIADFEKAHRGNMTEVCNFVLDAIDRILGEDATEKIFAGIELDERVIMGTYAAIIGEIIEQYQNIPALDKLQRQSGTSTAHQTRKHGKKKRL